MTAKSDTESRITRLLTPSADRSRTLRRLETVAHATTTAAFALTIVLVTTGLASELNPIADSLFGSVGWAATGAVAIAVIAGAFAFYERHVETTPRLILAAGASLAIAGIIDLGINLWLLSRTGLPYSVHWEAYGPAIAVVLIAGAVAIARREITPIVVRELRRSHPAARAVAIAILVVTSVVAMPFMGEIAPDRADHDGTASAAVENATHVNSKSTVAGPNDVRVVNDGAKMYVGNHSGTIYEYDLSTKWDISTATKSGETTITDNLNGFDLADNGTKFYAVDDQSEKVHQYSLSTPYDITTLSKAKTKDTTSELTNPTAVYMSPDGTRMYMAGNGYNLYEYHLSTPYDLASATYVRSMSEDSPSGVTFNSDGSKLLTSHTFNNGNPNDIHERDVSDPYNISSVTFVDEFDTSNQDTSPSGVDLGAEDTKMYVSGGASDAIYEYDVDVSGAEPVSGTVTDPHDQAIEGATVELEDSTGTVVDTATTDSTGAYEVGAPEIGEHTVTADDGTYTSSKTVDVPEGGISGVDLVVGKQVDVVVTDQEGNRVPNATIETWLANETEIQNQMELSAQEAEEKADELLRDSRNVAPDQFDENRKVMDDDAAYGDFEGEGVLVHDASEWELSGYETRFGVISRDVAPDLGGPGTVHSGDERLVLSVWDIGSSSLFEDDVDSEVDGAETVSSERTIVIEQVDGPTKIDDKTVTTREFIEITDVSANQGTKTHYAASVDLPKGFYKVYLEGQSASATYHSIGDPDEVSGLIENDIQDDADQYTDRAQSIRDRLNNGIFERQRVKTDANGYAEINLNGQVAMQAYKSDAPNVDPGQMSVEEIRDLHEAEEYLGAVYYSPTPKHVDTREVSDSETVEVGVIRAGGLPQQDLSLADQVVQELRGYLEDEIPVHDDLDLGDTGLTELEETRDTLLAMVNGNAEAEEILANTFPEHATDDGEVDLRPVSQYSTKAEGYSDQIHALRTALDRAPSSTDTSTEGEIEDDVLNMRLSTGGIRDGANVDDVEVLVHWQDGTSEPIPSDYWHIESGVAGGDAVVIEDYPIPSDRATATVEILAETSDGVARGTETFENPAFDGDHLRFRSITASTLTPGSSETISVRPRLEAGSSATLKNATVRAPDGTVVDATVTTDDVVRFETSGEGSHSIRLEYEDAGTTWVKSTRITARSVGLDTPPEVHERTDDGQYALASGLEDAEVADEAAGTRTRMTAVIGAGEHAPSVVHYYPDLDDSDEKLKVEIKAGEYRETVNNRVSTAVHVDLSEDALVWVDGTPIDEDGTTSAGSIQTTNGSEIVRTMTDENGETTVRVVQDPTFVQEVRHNLGAWLATLTIAPIGGMALTVAEVLVTVLSSAAELAATAAIPTAAAASEVVA